MSLSNDAQIGKNENRNINARNKGIIVNSTYFLNSVV